MTKEVRNNLIFFALFMVISVPGAVMLFKKKLDPEAAPMYLPKPTPNQAAYMHPIEVPTRVARVMPVGVAEWTAGLAGEHFPALQLRETGLPVMSRDRHVEVLASGVDEIGLLVWDDASAVTVDAGSAEVVEQLDVPGYLVESIKNVGYPVPPARVTVVRLELSPVQADPESSRTLALSWDGDADLLVWSPSGLTLPETATAGMNMNR